VADYVRYAKLIIERYDKYVTTWYTFNEPQYCNWVGWTPASDVAPLG